MKIIKTKRFAKWANKNDIDDKSLYKAAKEIISGFFEVSYGGGVIKKRVSNKGRGKSGSVRTVVAHKCGTNCFFIYGFEKSAKSNISANEEKAMKIIGSNLIAHTDNEIIKLMKNGALIEVKDE